MEFVTYSVTREAPATFGAVRALATRAAPLLETPLALGQGRGVATSPSVLPLAST
jgi:hypothetical protein